MIVSLSGIVDELGSRTAPPPMQTLIVAIDGLGGAGKSTLADRLSKVLDDAPIIHTDDFASWDEPVGWWPRLIDQVLRPLSTNRAARYQRYDWPSRSMAEWHDVELTRYLVLEGVSSSREAFQPFLGFTIWIETPREERLRRGLERDGVEAEAQWLEWMEAEDGYLTREEPDRRADVILDGTKHLPD